MKLLHALLGFTAASIPAQASAVQGIHELADRLFQGRANQFDIVLTQDPKNYSRWNTPTNDNYTVTKGANGKIRVEGTTLSALSRGYFTYNDNGFP